MFRIASSLLRSPLLNLTLRAGFALPKHEVLGMPALSPTMKEGKILKWLKKQGEKVEPGDAIAEIETDKATMAFEVQEKGYIAKIHATDGFVAIGDPLIVITKKSDDVSQFNDYKFGAPAEATPSPAAQTTSTPPLAPPKAESKPTKSYPAHNFLQMPAVSPTMTEGKILKWNVKPGDAFKVGDSLFSIETDKATMDYEATEKGILAKVIAGSNTSLPIGKNVAVIVKKMEDVAQFTDFVEGSAEASAPAASQPAAQEKTQKKQQAVSQTVTRQSGERVIASPIAKSIAGQKGIDLSQVQGSGPNGRILKQDVEGYTAPKKVQAKPQVTTAAEPVKQVKAPTKPKGFVVPENPYEDIPLSSMRKTIANRLSESKQTIPHYYITQSIEMGATNILRNQLNRHQKENGVKISVNDIIIKAMALALRDVPNVNVQWVNNSVRKFKYSDISVAVAIEGGLVTPIVFRADTLGLLDIARRTKDIAKRAKEGKLDPYEYIGGTTTVSNLGMFGVNTVTSIINPPQASILGVGKTEKRLIVVQGKQIPYRIAEIMDVIGSFDHRAVDGALGAVFLNRLKHYLQNPTHMLL